MKKKVTWYMEEEMVKAVKHKAIESGKKLSEIIQDALVKYLANDRRSSKMNRN